MTNLARIEMSWKLYQQGVGVDQIAVAVDRHRATVFRWLKGIRNSNLYSGLHYVGGLRQYLTQYRGAKQRPRQKRFSSVVTTLLLKKRQQTNWCGQKLAWWLKVEHQIKISVATIYRYFQQAGLKLTGAWQKWVRRSPLPTATKPREVIQADKIDLGELWVHNFIDCHTREVVSIVVTSEDSQEAYEAAQLAQQSLGPIIWLQTDNGSEYKGQFDRLQDWYQQRRHITPGQKEENGYIESFHRSLRRECVGWGHYRRSQLLSLQDQINTYLDHYHTERPHLGLNLKTPQEVMESHLT